MTTFRELEALVAVVDMGSFERAALFLNASQSAVSRLIKELEAGFQRPLFNRAQRSATLSVDGQEVLRLAREVLRRRNAMLERFTDLSATPSHLRLGVTELVSTTWLPRFVAALRKRHAHVRIELTVNLTPHLYTLLRERRLDLAIVGEISQFPSMVRVIVGAAKFGWYCAPSLGLPARISTAVFEQQTVLLLGPTRGTGAQIARWLPVGQLNLQNVMHCDSWAAMSGIAAAGLGVACLPEAVAAEAVGRGVLRPVELPLPSPWLEYGALVRADAVSAFHQEAVQLAQQTCDFSSLFQAPSDA